MFNLFLKDTVSKNLLFAVTLVTLWNLLWIYGSYFGSLSASTTAVLLDLAFVLVVMMALCVRYRILTAGIPNRISGLLYADDANKPPTFVIWDKGNALSPDAVALGDAVGGLIPAVSNLHCMGLYQLIVRSEPSVVDGGAAADMVLKKLIMKSSLG